MLRTRTITTLRTALASALLALGVSAAPAAAAVPNACLYSYDQEWREVDISVTGTTSATSGGTPVSAGTALTPGDTVTLSGATINATLPDWVAKFGAEGGWLTDGDDFLVEGWITLTASNTAEGTQAPIHFTSVAHTSLVYTAGGEVDETLSDISIDPVSLPTMQWTATGGTVRVSQAYGDTLGPLPVGRNGELVTPEGSLAVKATIPISSNDVFTLTLECLPGTTGGIGLRGLAEVLPPAIGTLWNAPAYTGALQPGGPLTTPLVDSEIPPTAGPVRAALDQAVGVDGRTLVVRLSPAQRAEWLGSGAHQVSASVQLAGTATTSATQLVTANGVLADGATLLQLQLPITTWARTSGTISTIAPTGPITLHADGRPDLVLTPRSSGPGSFAEIHPARIVAKIEQPDTTEDGSTRIGTDNPPSLGDTRGFLPPPPARPKPLAATVKTTKLKPNRKRQVTLKLSNPRDVSTKVKVRVRSKNKVKVRGKRRYLTITRTTTKTLRAHKSHTIKLTLSEAARTLLRTRPSVKVRVTVTAVRSTTTAPATTTMTLRR